MATTGVGAKKSLFKRPAWASKSTTTTDDNSPIFGQGHLYEEIVAEKKIRKSRKAEVAAEEEELAEKKRNKQKEKELRILSNKKRNDEQERESKRRRVSKDVKDHGSGSDADTRSMRSATVTSQDSQTSLKPVQKEEQRTLRSTPKNRKKSDVESFNPAATSQTKSQRGKQKKQESVTIPDDDDDEITILQPDEEECEELYDAPKRKSVRPPKKVKRTEPESDEEEDEYLRELKAKAREEARTQQAQRTSDSPTNQDLATTHLTANGTSRSPSNRRATSTPAAEEPEDEVKIWIQTIIPNAKDVIVTRRINQPLEQVKDFWCKRNNLIPAIANQVFFTWNGTRLYNSTTMRGIIDRLKQTHPTKDGSDPSNGQITIEAVTDEIFAYRAKQRERQLVESYSQPQDETENQEALEDATPPPQPKPGIVIKLQAQGLEEMPIRVRPNTTVRKILTAFCHMRNIEAGKETWLTFDGERLDDESTAEEAEFEQDDTVEVHIR